MSVWSVVTPRYLTFVYHGIRLPLKTIVSSDLSLPLWITITSLVSALILIFHSLHRYLGVFNGICGLLWKVEDARPGMPVLYRLCSNTLMVLSCGLFILGMSAV